MKFSCAASKPMTSVMSPYCSETPRMRPNQKAALAISSATVGPAGSTRFSMRRWGLPLSEMP